MASYMLDKPKQMTRKQIYLNILMFIFLSVLFTKSIVSYESLQKLYVLKIGTNIHIFLEIFPSFEKELLKQLTQSVFTCSKLTIETLQQRCEICSKLTIKKPKRHQNKRKCVAWKVSLSLSFIIVDRGFLTP